jgi:hypothetical protein
VVRNLQRNAAWGAALQASNKRLGEVSAHAPKAHDGVTDLCLSYHLVGQCVENCNRSTTHRRLQAPEKERMNTFIAERLPEA